MSNSTVYFISAANRGIGLSLAKELSARENVLILGTARDPDAATELKNLPNVKVFKLDVSSKESVDAVGVEVAKVTDKIDVLISNAGIGGTYTSSLETKEDTWIERYKINTLGPIFLVQSLYPLLQKGDLKKIYFISSMVGSIGGKSPFSSSAYGQSKAALNYTSKELSFELASEGFTVAALHPGLVADTDMGSEGVKVISEKYPHFKEFLDSISITTNVSVAGILNLVDDPSTENNGKFLAYDGKEIPW